MQRVVVVALAILILPFAYFIGAGYGIWCAVRGRAISEDWPWKIKT